MWSVAWRLVSNPNHDMLFTDTEILLDTIPLETTNKTAYNQKVYHCIIFLNITSMVIL